jgi:hypothetical protein
LNSVYVFLIVETQLERSMKHSSHAAAWMLATSLLCAIAHASNVQPAPGTTQPGVRAQSPNLPTLKKADLTAEMAGPQFLFRVKNIGTANSPASTTRVMCYTNTAGPPSERCVEGTHFVIVLGVLNPPGTTKAGGNVWMVPTGGLDATTGFTTFSLNIKTVPALQQQGLRFQVCADAPNAIAELNEANNCQWSVYNWPN